MQTNELKKLIYKQNPYAEFNMFRGGTLYYISKIQVDGEYSPVDYQVFFEVPSSDTGTTDFYDKMNAKYLLRWIKNEQ